MTSDHTRQGHGPPSDDFGSHSAGLGPIIGDSRSGSARLRSVAGRLQIEVSKVAICCWSTSDRNRPGRDLSLVDFRSNRPGRDPSLVDFRSKSTRSRSVAGRLQIEIDRVATRRWSTLDRTDQVTTSPWSIFFGIDRIMTFLWSISDRIDRVRDLSLVDFGGRIALVIMNGSPRDQFKWSLLYVWKPASRYRNLLGLYRSYTLLVCL